MSRVRLRNPSRIVRCPRCRTHRCYAAQGMCGLCRERANQRMKRERMTPPAETVCGGIPLSACRDKDAEDAERRLRAEEYRRQVELHGEFTYLTAADRERLGDAPAPQAKQSGVKVACAGCGREFVRRSGTLVVGGQAVCWKCRKLRERRVG